MSDEEIKALQEELAAAHLRANALAFENVSLCGQLRKHQSYVKTLETENSELRDRVLRVTNRFGRDETIGFELSVQHFYWFETKDREEFIREAVLDAMAKLLRHASGAAHLDTLRRKAGL